MSGSCWTKTSLGSIRSPAGFVGSNANFNPDTCKNRPSCCGYLETAFSSAFKSVEPLTLIDYSNWIRRFVPVVEKIYILEIGVEKITRNGKDNVRVEERENFPQVSDFKFADRVKSVGPQSARVENSTVCVNCLQHYIRYKISFCWCCC